ncbi:hypothetical protein KQX54_005218 [Cotesia glomerata]|uniref:Uncharacterized protein n=1 Tax=Cotesia glomerata TaxID=32391 RepID=A0AAV7HX97_COTGL|nr:hypothetical protein KQX54_005218 [Cotesia glomerata]
MVSIPTEQFREKPRLKFRSNISECSKRLVGTRGIEDGKELGLRLAGSSPHYITPSLRPRGMRASLVHDAKVIRRAFRTTRPTPRLILMSRRLTMTLLKAFLYLTPDVFFYPRNRPIYARQFECTPMGSIDSVCSTIHHVTRPNDLELGVHVPFSTKTPLCC